MRFLIDRCAGARLAQWLRGQGHDVVEAAQQGDDPGDAGILQRAVDDDRILVRIDTDFGLLIFGEGRAAPRSRSPSRRSCGSADRDLRRPAFTPRRES